MRSIHLSAICAIFFVMVGLASGGPVLTQNDTHRIWRAAIDAGGKERPTGEVPGIGVARLVPNIAEPVCSDDLLVNGAYRMRVGLLHCPRPRIITQPTKQMAVVGECAVFFVEAVGAGPLTYQWRKEGVPIPGATMDYLLICPVTMVDAGVYDVVVSNVCGPVVSLSARLTVCPFFPCGDLNGDGLTNGRDIQRFVDAYLAMSSEESDVCAADFDRSGMIDQPDSAPFVFRLLTGGC